MSESLPIIAILLLTFVVLRVFQKQLRARFADARERRLREHLNWTTPLNRRRRRPSSSSWF